MKLLASQTDVDALSQLGREAVSLLERQDFQSLADRFGYVFAGGKPPAIAIEMDWQSYMAEFHASPGQYKPVPRSTAVKYFKPNDSGFFALIECFFVAPEGCPTLAELIVFSRGEDKHLTLEGISLVGWTPQP